MQKIMFVGTCLLLGFAGGVHAGHWRAFETLSETDFFDDVPRVLSATRLHQPLVDAPMSVTVIDREMIEASGAREIYELFRLVPGVQIGADSGHGHIVTYHGMSDQYARRMQILIDGRSVYNPGIGGIEWSEFPIALDDIQRIEFFRGPNAAAYGANAFLGTISIFTFHPAQTPGTSLKLTGGNNGIRQFLVRHSSREVGIDYRISAEYFADDGLITRHDDEIARKLDAHFDYPATTHDNLEFRFGFNIGERGVGEAGNPFYSPGKIDRETSFQQLRWNHTVDAENEYTFQLYHNHDTLNETHRSRLLEPYEDSPRVDRIDFEFFNQRRYDALKRLVWGGSMRRDEVYAPVLFNGRESPFINRLYRLFGHYEWRLSPSLMTNFGLMWERNQISGGELSPRIAINHRLSLEQTLKASISRATRTPIFFEDRGNLRVTFLPIPPLGFVGGPATVYQSAGNLRSERIVSREIGYLGQFKEKALTVDARLFNDSIHDLIQLGVEDPPPPGKFPPPPVVWNNRGWARVSGLEASIDWHPSSNSRLIFNYAYADVDSNSEEIEDSVPRHTFGFLAIYDILPSLRVSANYYHLGEMVWLDRGHRIDTYDRLDLKLRYQLDKRAILSLTAQEVLGEREDFRKENKTDTLVFASISIAL